MLRAMRVALTLAAVLLTLARPVACSSRENCDVQEGDCVDIASHTGSSTVLSRNPGRRLASSSQLATVELPVANWCGYGTV